MLVEAVFLSSWDMPCFYVSELVQLLTHSNWIWRYQGAVENTNKAVNSAIVQLNVAGHCRGEMNICLQEAIFTCAFFILFCFQEIIAPQAGVCSPYLLDSQYSAWSIFYMTGLYFRADESYIIQIDFLFFLCFLFFFFFFSLSNKWRRER